MNRITAVTAGVLRLAIALAVGAVLLLAIQFALFFAALTLNGGRPLPLSGLLFLIALAVALWMALRFARSGRMNNADRIMGSSAITLLALAVAAVSFAALFAFLGLHVLSILFLFAGGAETADVLLTPLKLKAFLIAFTSNLVATCLGYAAYRFWVK